MDKPPAARTLARTPLRTVAHLASLVIILAGASLCWFVLAAVIETRTNQASRTLGPDVQALWGGPQRQLPPTVVWRDVSEDGGPASAPRAAGPPLRSPESSEVSVGLRLDQRRKGLLWYSTYRAEVEAVYTVANDGEAPARGDFCFFLPAARGMYDDFHAFVGQKEVDTLRDASGECGPAVSLPLVLAPGEKERVRVRYTSQGLDTWTYALGTTGGRTRNFHLTARTDFGQVDFPATGMSPTRKERTPDGWELQWDYENLVGGQDIAIEMPKRLNPGPLAARISRFAPVSLVFFLGVLFFLYLLRGIPLHPAHYAFLAASFFSFHVLFSHLVDHLPLALSFGIAAAVSVFLVVSYLRVVVNPRFAFLQAGGLQLVYLVFFSLAHFYEGWTGLAVTTGGIVTLFFVMQLTARLDWEQVLPLDRRAAAASE